MMLTLEEFSFDPDFVMVLEHNVCMEDGISNAIDKTDLALLVADLEHGHSGIVVWIHSFLLRIRERHT